MSVIVVQPASMVPQVKMPITACTVSAVSAGFTSPMLYGLTLNVGDPSSLLAPGQSLQNGVEITTEVVMTSADPELGFSWTLITEPAPISGTIKAPLDSTQSFMNGAPNAGTATLSFTSDNITYALLGNLLSAPIDMPLANGALPLDVTFNLYVNNILILSQPYLGVTLNSLLIGSEAPLAVSFVSNGFTGTFPIQGYRRPLAPTCLTGSIRILDMLGEIAADFHVNAELAPHITGILSTPSQINESAVTSYVKASWICDSLFLTLNAGEVHPGFCLYEIPTYSPNVTVTIQLRADA